MREYLVFTLRGPMQSWGTSAAVGEVRATAGRPGRSGVIGLVAAALGIRRDRPEAIERLHSAARIAVRADSFGERMIDYQTAQTPRTERNVSYHTRRDELVSKVRKDRLSTILSSREYLAGAAFTVCVWLDCDAGYALEDMRDALTRPKLTLYLGRKSCPPGFPLMPEVFRAENAAEAFALYDETFAHACAASRDKPAAGRHVWADVGHAVPDGGERAVEYSVRDVLTNSTRRQFAVRRECHFTLPDRGDGHVHE